jgi:iron complex transport system substrate-binding protein
MTRNEHPNQGTRRGQRILVAAVLLCCLVSIPAVAAPQRIASLSLCADQLLLSLVDRRRIVSVTRFASAPSISGVADAITGIPRNRGSAEDILPLGPDLIVAGEYTQPSTKALFRKLGIPLLEISVATDFDGVRKNIRRIATAVDATEKADHMIDTLNSRLAAAAGSAGPAPSLLFYRLGGYSQGRHTLMDAIIRHAGFVNHAAQALPGVGRVSLETVVVTPPDVIVLGSGHGPRSSRAAEYLSHPAFRQLRSKIPSVTLPDRLWICGLPSSVDAVERLADFRRSLTPTPRKPKAATP